MSLFKNAKKSRSNYIMIIGFLLLLESISLWCIDVSVSAMISKGIVRNGFYSINPEITYHIGLYLSIIISFILFIISTHFILEKYESDKNE